MALASRLAAAKGVQGRAREHSAAERGAQPSLVDPPEIMLDTIDKSDRDHVGVLPQIVFRSGDVAFGPRHAEFARYPGDDLAGVVAEMASRPGEEGDNVLGDLAGFSHQYLVSSPRISAQP